MNSSSDQQLKATAVSKTDGIQWDDFLPENQAQILSFLDFGDLKSLRSLSKSFKSLAEKQLYQRSTAKLPVSWSFSHNVCSTVIKVSSGWPDNKYTNYDQALQRVLEVAKDYGNREESTMVYNEELATELLQQKKKLSYSDFPDRSRGDAFQVWSAKLIAFLKTETKHFAWNLLRRWCQFLHIGGNPVDKSVPQAFFGLLMNAQTIQITKIDSTWDDFESHWKDGEEGAIMLQLVDGEKFVIELDSSFECEYM